MRVGISCEQPALIPRDLDLCAKFFRQLIILQLIFVQIPKLTGTVTVCTLSWLVLPLSTSAEITINYNKIWVNLKETLITACKRSFGQGNIFTSVCDSFCSQWGREVLWCHFLFCHGQHPHLPITEQHTHLNALPWAGTPWTAHIPGQHTHTPLDNTHIYPGQHPTPPTPKVNKPTSRWYATHWNTFLF